MKFWLGLLVFGFSCWPLATLAGSAPSEPPPRVIRSLIFVETSLETVSSKAQLAEALSGRVLFGLNSEMLPGDSFLIWTFNETVQKERYFPIAWNPRNKQLFADRLARSIDDQPFYGHGRFEVVMQELRRIIPDSDGLTITVIGNGSHAPEGTPFDLKMSADYANVRQKLGGVPELLVTTLLTQNGRLIGWRLEPAGRTQKGNAPATATPPTSVVEEKTAPVAKHELATKQNSERAHPENRSSAVPKARNRDGVAEAPSVFPGASSELDPADFEFSETAKALPRPHTPPPHSQAAPEEKALSAPVQKAHAALEQPATIALAPVHVSKSVPSSSPAKPTANPDAAGATGEVAGGGSGIRYQVAGAPTRAQAPALAQQRSPSPTPEPIPEETGTRALSFRPHPAEAPAVARAPAQHLGNTTTVLLFCGLTLLVGAGTTLALFARTRRLTRKSSLISEAIEVPSPLAKAAHLAPATEPAARRFSSMPVLSE